MNKRIPVCIALLTFIASSPAGAFNSEEHKYLVDKGVAVLYGPLGFDAFFKGSGTKKADPGSYAKFLAEAKTLATGANSKSSSQDNCYYHGYRQSKYNDAIFIPTPSQVPKDILHIPSVVGSPRSPDYFSLGELSALYGDYRRVTYCSLGRCTLTNSSVTKITFYPPALPVRNRLLWGRGYCPKPLAAGKYLRMIASGVVAPHGNAGNASGNSAGDTQYDNAGWWGDEMMRNATLNDWHFSQAAVAWYIGMHRLALQASVKAINYPKYWVAALHYEANALHALMDLFSLGHVMVDRSVNVAAIVRQSRKTNDPVYRYMDKVMALGGAKRAFGGRIDLGKLPTLNSSTQPRAQRKDFLATSMPSIKLSSIGEALQTGVDASLAYIVGNTASKQAGQHDAFNKAGGWVYNVNGTRFVIFGDGKLEKMKGGYYKGESVAIDAVTLSLASLIDSHRRLKRNPGNLDRESRSPGFLRALREIPIYIEKDYLNRVKGRYARYAEAVYSNLGLTPPRKLRGCLIPRDYDDNSCTKIKVPGTSRQYVSVKGKFLIPSRAERCESEGTKPFREARGATGTCAPKPPAR